MVNVISALLDTAVKPRYDSLVL
ncbi:MAG: palindromic element RPE4 domain-containing protein [Rickettsia sp.]